MWCGQEYLYTDGKKLENSSCCKGKTKHKTAGGYVWRYEQDDFEKYNTTSPLHPQRIQKDKEFEEKRRLMIIASLQNEGIEPDTSLETEELRKMLQDVIDKKSKDFKKVE